MKAPDIELLIRNWALRTPNIQSVVLFGSQARAGCDTFSDWDLHVIAKQTAFLSGKAWTEEIGLDSPLVYACRDGVVGTVKRITVLWPVVEIDFVVLQAFQMTLARLAVAMGLHRRSSALQRKLGDMALILRPGYRFLHGEQRWGKLYRRVCDEVPDPSLKSVEILKRAELFVADYIWVRRKIARGELLAAQRVLHRSLAERNFELIAELKKRRGETGWPEARRVEDWTSAQEYSGLRVAAQPTAAELGAALESCASTFRGLISELEGASWRWPLG